MVAYGGFNMIAKFPYKGGTFWHCPYCHRRLGRIRHKDAVCQTRKHYWRCPEPNDLRDFFNTP